MYEKIADLITKEARHFHLTGKISSPVLTVAGSTIQSGISGFINTDIVEQDINLIKPNELFIDPKHPDFTFPYYDVRAGLFKDEIVLFKSVSPNLSLQQENHSFILAYEIKILKFVGLHPNIIRSHGIVENENQPMSIYDHCMDLCFEEYKKMKRPLLLGQVKVLLCGLVKATEFLHLKGIIHLNLVESSIIMRYNAEKNEYYPVIFHFSCCCPIQSTKVLDPFFQERFKFSKHLPIDILRGKSIPSFNCDIYSFGVLLSHFSNYIYGMKEQNIVDSIAINLLKTKSNYFPDFVYSFVN